MSSTIAIIDDLEKKRTRIDEYLSENFSLDTFLERGHPSAEEADKAMEQMRENAAEIKRLQTSLNEQIVILRKSNKPVIDVWVKLHTDTCKIIISKSENTVSKGETMKSTRIFVARDTMEEWQKVACGEAFFVNPNSYYLFDYNRFFSQVFANYKSGIAETRPSDSGLPEV